MIKWLLLMQGEYIEAVRELGSVKGLITKSHPGRPTIIMLSIKGEYTYIVSGQSHVCMPSWWYQRFRVGNKTVADEHVLWKEWCYHESHGNTCWYTAFHPIGSAGSWSESLELLIPVDPKKLDHQELSWEEDSVGHHDISPRNSFADAQ
jgi:hypothetical protein